MERDHDPKKGGDAARGGGHAPHHENGIEVNGYGTIIGISSPTAADPDKMKEMLRELVMEIANECMRVGAKAIGHVKCHLKTSGGYVKSDIVRIREGAYAESEISSAQKSGNLVLNSIIIGLDKSAIATVTTNVAERVLKKYGFTATVESDCKTGV